MFKYILSGLLLGAAHGMTVPVAAEPTKGYHTMDSMGCMMLLECTDNVKRVTRIQDIIDRYPDSDYGSVACLLYTSPSPRDQRGSRMPSSA